MEERKRNTVNYYYGICKIRLDGAFWGLQLAFWPFAFILLHFWDPLKFVIFFCPKWAKTLSKKIGFKTSHPWIQDVILANCGLPGKPGSGGKPSGVARAWVPFMGPFWRLGSRGKFFPKFTFFLLAERRYVMVPFPPIAVGGHPVHIPFLEPCPNPSWGPDCLLHLQRSPQSHISPSDAFFAIFFVVLPKNVPKMVFWLISGWPILALRKGGWPIFGLALCAGPKLITRTTPLFCWVCVPSPFRPAGLGGFDPPNIYAFILNPG